MALVQVRAVLFLVFKHLFKKKQYLSDSFCRYYSGDVFQNHVDTCYHESECVRSFYTVNIYLNDGFTDGKTRFFDDDNRMTCSVQPAPGLALIFAQPALRFYAHDGERVADGTKYLIRSDVMYRRVDQ